MTNTELIQAIRNEIERMKGIGGIVPLDNREQKTGYESALIDIETFLDTLEESENPMNQDEDLNEEIKKFVVEYGYERSEDILLIAIVARHFAQWGAEHAEIDVTDFCKPIDPGIAQCIADHSWEMLGEDEKPIPNDLEEAAEEYADCNSRRWQEDGDIYYDHQKIVTAFIAGAKWQAEKDTRDMYMSDNRHFQKVYELGKKDMREQMISALKNGGELPIEFYDKLHEVDRAAFQNGKKAMKEQMLREAVEWTVTANLANRPVIYLDNLHGFNIGDKVKIIIVKED